MHPHIMPLARALLTIVFAFALPVSAAAQGNVSTARGLSADPNAPNFAFEQRGSVRAKFAILIPVLAPDTSGSFISLFPLVELHDGRNSDVLPVKSLPNEFWRGRFGIEVGWQVRLPIARSPTLRVAVGAEHESDHKSFDIEYYERNLNDHFSRADLFWPLQRGFISGALIERFHSNTHTRVCVGSRHSFEQAMEFTVNLHPWKSDRFALFASVFASRLFEADCIAAEASLVTKAGFHNVSRHGVWQLYVSINKGNDVGQNPGWTATKGGLGLAWSPTLTQ